MELLAALLLTVITIMGLAHTLGLGNGFIDRYATARAALARATGQLEHVRGQVKDGLSVTPPIDTLTNGDAGVVIVPGINGSVRTQIVGVDDPVNDIDPTDNDYFKVNVSVTWTQGGMTDSVVVSTLVYAQ